MLAVQVGTYMFPHGSSSRNQWGSGEISPHNSEKCTPNLMELASHRMPARAGCKGGKVAKKKASSKREENRAPLDTSHHLYGDHGSVYKSGAIRRSWQCVQLSGAIRSVSTSFTLWWCLSVLWFSSPSLPAVFLDVASTSFSLFNLAFA